MDKTKYEIKADKSFQSGIAPEPVDIRLGLREDDVGRGAPRVRQQLGNVRRAHDVGLRVEGHWLAQDVIGAVPQATAALLPCIHWRWAIASSTLQLAPDQV